jgi:hypothetical protein
MVAHDRLTLSVEADALICTVIDTVPLTVTN